MADTRSLDQAKERIETVATELGVPEATERMAVQLLDVVHDQVDTEGLRMDILGAASLALACKHQSLPVTPKIVSTTWGDVTDDAYGDFETKLLLRRLEKVKSATEVNPPPTEPTELVEGYRETLGAPEEVTEAAGEILERLMTEAPEEVTGGTSPSGNAAGAFYLAACELGLRQEFTQERVADSSEVSKMTVRNRYQRIAEVLGGQPVLDYSLNDFEADQSSDVPGGGDGVESDADTEGDDRPVQTTDGSDETSDTSRDSDDTHLETGSRDTGRPRSDDRIGLSVGSYAVLEWATESREEGSEELLVESLREVTKRLLDGEELDRRSTDGERVPVPVSLPRRVETFLKTEVGDPESEFQSVGELADVAVSEELGAAVADQTMSVRLRGDVLTAARRLRDDHAECETVEELLRVGAVELLGAGDVASGSGAGVVTTGEVSVDE